MFRYIAFITTNHHQTHPSLCHWCLLTIATTLKKKTSFNQLEKIIKSSSYWISKENYLKFFCVCNIVYYIFNEMYLYQYQYSFNMQNPHFHVSFQPYIKEHDNWKHPTIYTQFAQYSTSSKQFQNDFFLFSYQIDQIESPVRL